MSLKVLPKIYYDLSIKNENSIPVVIPDVLVRIQHRMSESDKRIMLFEYDMLEGDTPELVSLKFYNTMDYNWVIMLINDRYDYISDFPMKYEILEKYCQSKYGADMVNELHHYEDAKGNVVDQYYYDYYNDSGNQPAGVYADDPIHLTWNTEQWGNAVLLKTMEGKPISNFEYEEQINDSKRKIKLLKPQYIGNFVKQYETKVKETTL